MELALALVFRLALVDSRRRKASASLEQGFFLMDKALIDKFQTPKGVCLIGATRFGAIRDTLRGIPDAERRLPHWSPILSLSGRWWRDYSRRRKASASLEPGSAEGRRQREAKIPDAERRLPHWSVRALSERNPRQRIPDAERRLPHWSVGSRLAAGRERMIPDAERRLPHWSSLTGGLAFIVHIIPDAERRLPHWSRL